MKRTWLAFLRTKQGLTQGEVANAVAISRSHYSDIENGRRDPSGIVGSDIAKLLNFDMSFFYRYDDAIRVVVSDEQSATLETA